MQAVIETRPLPKTTTTTENTPTPLPLHAPSFQQNRKNILEKIQSDMIVSIQTNGKFDKSRLSIIHLTEKTPREVIKIVQPGFYSLGGESCPILSSRPQSQIFKKN